MVQKLSNGKYEFENGTVAVRTQDGGYKISGSKKSRKLRKKRISKKKNTTKRTSRKNTTKRTSRKNTTKRTSKKPSKYSDTQTGGILNVENNDVTNNDKLKLTVRMLRDFYLKNY
jgi:hypothetical protein